MSLEKMLLHQITDKIIMGGQPQPDDLSALRDQGITTLINMRSDPGRAAVEEKNAVTAGLNYLFLPLPAYEIEPEHLDLFRQQVDHHLETPGQLCIHCRSATRVALLWMLSRIAHDGWTEEAAVAELEAAGYDEDSIEVFRFCTDDYFERLAEEMEELVNG